MLEVRKVRYVEDYKLFLEFSDGKTGTVDLERDLEGEVFGPLRDRSLFASVSLNNEIGTISWPNGADLAPEYLIGLVESMKASA